MAQKTIAQIMHDYIENHRSIVHQGKFNGKDFLELQSILNGTADNFTVFNNAGGRNFHILFYSKELWESTDRFEEWIKSELGYQYMYKIHGREVIVQDIRVF